MDATSALPSRVRTIAHAEAIDRAARRHLVACGAGTMLWRSWGDSGDPVVLLHGGSGSWNHWVRNIVPLLAAGRQVWVPDLPGFGDSASPPKGGDADALPEPMETALRSLLGDAAVDLVGFSFGTMVAAFIAAQWPRRARRLVLSGAPALGIDRADKLVLQPWLHLAPGPERDAAMRENLARLMLAQPESNDDLALALHAPNLRARPDAAAQAVTHRHHAAHPAEVRCPVYGIWGEQDVLYRGVQDRIASACRSRPLSAP